MREGTVLEEVVGLTSGVSSLIDSRSVIDCVPDGFMSDEATYTIQPIYPVHPINLTDSINSIPDFSHPAADISYLISTNPIDVIGKKTYRARSEVIPEIEQSVISLWDYFLKKDILRCTPYENPRHCSCKVPLDSYVISDGILDTFNAKVDFGRLSHDGDPVLSYIFESAGKYGVGDHHCTVDALYLRFTLKKNPLHMLNRKPRVSFGFNYGMNHTFFQDGFYYSRPEFDGGYGDLIHFFLKIEKYMENGEFRFNPRFFTDLLPQVNSRVKEILG